MVRTSFLTVISPHCPNIFRDSHLSPWSKHLSQVPCCLIWLHPGNLSPIHFVQCCVIDQERLSIRSYYMEHVRLVNVKSQAHLVAVGLHQGQVFLESSSRVGRRCGVICISEGRDRCLTVSPSPSVSLEAPGAGRVKRECTF